MPLLYIILILSDLALIFPHAHLSLLFLLKLSFIYDFLLKQKLITLKEKKNFSSQFFLKENFTLKETHKS